MHTTSSLQQRFQHPLLGYEAVPDGLYPAFGEWMGRRHGWNPLTHHHHHQRHDDNNKGSVILRAPNVLNALSMALCAFTEPGECVVVQPPVFFDFYDILKENHRTVVENPLEYNREAGRYFMNLPHLKELLISSFNNENNENKIKLMFLCNPHNPIGRVWTKQELQNLAVICRQHNILIVSDEIHADLCFGKEKGDDATTPSFTSMASIDPDHCIALHSPAKTFNIASCCSAFTIILNKELRTQMQTENSRLTVSKNNAFASVAMEAAYRNGDAWVDAMLDYVKGNIQLLHRRLLDSATMSHRIRLVQPQGTFLVWLDCRDLGVDDSDGYALRTWFRNHAGWAVTRGTAFGKEQGHGFVRVNLACPRQRLVRALDRLEKAVSSKMIKAQK